MGEVIYRDLDAAARAYFDGDNAPLLRLFAENNLSAGYRQPGGRAAPPDERAAQDRDAIARKEAKTRTSMRCSPSTSSARCRLT